MSDSIQIGRWLLRPDVGRTKAAHSRLLKSGAAECGCTGCENFEAVRPQLLSGPLGEILARLGIAPPWEVEAFECGRASSGLHHYGGWFHFVGTIESGSGAWRSVDDQPDARTADFERISPTLSIGFHTNVALLRAPFEGLPLVQLEFSAELPWVITAEEPL